MIYDKVEMIDRKTLEKKQLNGLKKTIDFCIHKSPFYKEMFKEMGIVDSSFIHNLKDIEKLPFTSKSDIRKNYPYGFLAVPIHKVARIHASSGTTGVPTIGYLTKKDLKTWQNAAARVLVLNGLEKKDIFQISVGYGLFTGAFGFHQGAEKIGATIIPASVGNTERQLKFLQDLGVTAITATPSYAVTLAEEIDKRNLTDLKLKKIFLGAERCSSSMRKRIEELSGATTADNYGMTEFFGPGLSGECEYRCGLHISEDLFYPEIIDPITNEVLKDGEEGELVLTSLKKEAMPFIRYRTGDITSITHKKCKCGRTSARILAPSRRIDEMVVFKGVNIFPSQIEEVLKDFSQISPHYCLFLTRKNHHDYAVLKMELTDHLDTYKKEDLEKLETKLTKKLKSFLFVKLDIEFVDTNTLERFTGKAKHIIDTRYHDEEK